MDFENAIVIINKTRLESLIERFNTRDQARFYIEHAGGDFQDYEDEHEAFHRALEKVVHSLQNELKTKVVDRKFVPNFLFSERDMVVVVGQDGLVANAAKYVNGLPILGINPDPTRYDGILLPFDTSNFEKGWQSLLRQQARYKEVTLAEAKTNDGQRLLAFNDLFIGAASHISARYKITHRGQTEQQSSSGIIVSTGAGHTGWMSSVLNMANIVTYNFGSEEQRSVLKQMRPVSFEMRWDAKALVFVTREPFKSKHSDVKRTAGVITHAEKLVIESSMPSNGIIFGDGVEADFIRFNSGTRVEIGVAGERARLVSNQ